MGSVFSSVGGILTGGAANDQAKYNQMASDKQQGFYNEAKDNLTPYITTGQNALTKATDIANTGFNFNPTQDQLEITPGYQFQMSQGLKGVQNSAAAKGWGVSGAALKEAATFSNQLASSNYQNQFNNALNQYNTNFNSQKSLADSGSTAATALAGNGLNTGMLIGNNLVGTGKAQAASDGWFGNAFLNGITTAAGIGFGGFGGGGGAPSGGGWTNQNVSYR